MDEADLAQESEQRFRERSLKMRALVPARNGLCLNCGIRSSGAYCDSECRDDHEMRTKHAHAKIS